MVPFFGALILIFLVFFSEIESSRKIEKIKMKKPASSEEEDLRRIALHATPRLPKTQFQPQFSTSIQNEALDLQETKPKRSKNKNPLPYNPHVSTDVQKMHKFVKERFNPELRLPPKHFQDNQKLTRQKIDREYSELICFNNRYPSELSVFLSKGRSEYYDSWLSHLKTLYEQQQRTLDKNMGDNNPHHQSHYPDIRSNPHFPGGPSGGGTDPHFPGDHSGDSEPSFDQHQHTSQNQQPPTSDEFIGDYSPYLHPGFLGSVPNPHFYGRNSGCNGGSGKED